MEKIHNFFGWLIEPFTEVIQENKKCNVVSLVKEKATFLNFRPNSFDEYIGQEKVKEILKQYMKGTQSRNRIFPHTLISGTSGTGKTTLAKIISNGLKVPFIESIASDLKEVKEIKEKIEKADGGILFLDEIHSISRDMAEKFYPLMEDFKYGNQSVKPFTLVGATTELGEIMRDRKPFYNRFKIDIRLDGYTQKDLIKIGRQYKERMFEEEKLHRDVYSIIARNARSTPRTMIKLLEATIYFDGNVHKVLFNFGIIQNGFSVQDLKVLKYIALNERGVGMQGIVNYLDTSAPNYIYEIEPFLLQNALLVRTPRGRKITEKGIYTITEMEQRINYLNASNSR